MELLEFTKAFGTEESCRQKFKEIRDSEGVICKHCGSEEHYWLSSKEQYQCKKCRFRTTLRSGTILEASKLPFQYWFMAIYLMSNMKKTLSAYQMQSLLGHKRYEPIWAMMHKIRKAMGARDARYMLQGEVEVDEGFFETLVPKEKKKEARKRGRGSQKQTMAMVFAESQQVDVKKKHLPARRCRYFKMIVCPNFKTETAQDSLAFAVDHKALKITDGHHTYKSLKKIMSNIQPSVTPSQKAHVKLPWVHTAIGNLKKILQGIFHHVKPEYLQNYLDEFCYKLNRRYFGSQLFTRGLIALTLA